MNALGLGHPLRDWLESKLVADVVAAGGDQTKAQGAVSEVLAQQSIFQWLASFNWQGLVAMILQILALLPKA
jgi:hypothetical protein